MQPYVTDIDWVKQKAEELGNNEATLNPYNKILEQCKIYTDADLTPIVMFYPIGQYFAVTSEQAIYKKFNA